MSRIALVPVFTIKAGMADEFLRHVAKQRDDCLEHEPGCEHFDVLRAPGDDSKVMLYEIYRDRQAIEDHRTTPHYPEFKEATADLIEGVDVEEWLIED